MLTAWRDKFQFNQGFRHIHHKLLSDVSAQMADRWSASVCAGPPIELGVKPQKRNIYMSEQAYNKYCTARCRRIHYN